MDDDLHIKSRDLCERCVHGECRVDCPYCPMFRPANAEGDAAGCLCGLIDEQTPCPYFREKTEPGFRQKATLKARCAK